MYKAKTLIRRLRRLTQINSEVICIASFTDAGQFADFAFSPDCSLAIGALQNQAVVGRVLTRQVGLKPDLRPNGLLGFNPSNLRNLRIALSLPI